MRLSTLFISSTFVLAGISVALPVAREKMLMARFSDSDLLAEVQARSYYDETPELYTRGFFGRFKKKAPQTTSGGRGPRRDDSRATSFSKLFQGHQSSQDDRASTHSHSTTSPLPQGHQSSQDDSSSIHSHSTTSPLLQGHQSSQDDSSSTHSHSTTPSLGPSPYEHQSSWNNEPLIPSQDDSSSASSSSHGPTSTQGHEPSQNDRSSLYSHSASSTDSFSSHKADAGHPHA